MKKLNCKPFFDKDAPIQHLIDEVYRSGYNLKKVVCITTNDAYQTNFDRFKKLVEAYASSVWNKQILVSSMNEIILLFTSCK